MNAVVFLRFCTVGLLNTAVGLAVIFLLMRIGQLDYIVANFLGYIVGFGISFALNRNWTFEHKGSLLDAGLQWALVVGVAYLLNLGVVIALHEFFGINSYVSQALGVAVYTAFAFVLGRFYVFRTSEV